MIASTSFQRRATAWAAVLLTLSAASAVAVEPEVLEAQSRRIAVIERVSPTVVAIFAQGGQGGGSGVTVSADGFVVTNFHVVEGQGPFMKCGLNDGRLYDAVLVGIDPTGDVAVIRLLGRDDFPAATLADSDTVRVGDGAYAMGNPFLLATDFQPTVTYGMVSGVRRYQFPAGTLLEYTDCIQVDTSINPGNSGGPLFNEDGELIGINGRISVEKRGRVNVGAGYAISINQVRNFFDNLKSGRIVDHATLGAVVSTNSDGSVTVSRILEQSEAYRRGLQVGDELVMFGGRTVDTANQFKNILGIYPAGWKLPLTYRRKGQEQQIIVRLRRLHRAAELELRGQDSPPPRPRRGPGPDAPPEEKQPESPLPEAPKDVAPPEAPESSGVPAAYADLYEARPRFANYWFNRAAQERLLSALKTWGFDGIQEPLQVSGRLDARTTIEFRLADQAIAVKIGDRTNGQQLDKDLEDLPPATGGLLPAMHALRGMLTRGAEAFSDTYYLGSEPLDGTGERVDVLMTHRGETLCRWYFDQSTGGCVGMDFALGEDQDECELRFGPLASFGSRQFPETISMRHAGTDLGVMKVSGVEAGRPANAAAAPAPMQ
ncbi:MAG: trypsin-like peptidase domain-containing protein [Planctomyces sp.]|nr:trypsin-like peptidase domain-containing protein [Planctomyces sp.]